MPINLSKIVFNGVDVNNDLFFNGTKVEEIVLNGQRLIFEPPGGHQVFTSNGSFTVPPGITQVSVIVIGSGASSGVPGDVSSYYEDGQPGVSGEASKFGSITALGGGYGGGGWTEGAGYKPPSDTSGESVGGFMGGVIYINPSWGTGQGIGGGGAGGYGGFSIGNKGNGPYGTGSHSYSNLPHVSSDVGGGGGGKDLTSSTINGFDDGDGWVSGCGAGGSGFFKQELTAVTPGSSIPVTVGKAKTPPPPSGYYPGIKGEDGIVIVMWGSDIINYTPPQKS